MDARILVVPYLVGREAEGMGAGPLALEEVASAALATCDVRRIVRSEPWTTEVAACFELNRLLAAEVASARADGVLPVVLTGNCHSQQAVVAGLGADDLGLVWLDCHADFNTPDTTETGFFDGYGLAMVVGDCWQALCATVPGFRPLREEDVVLVGVRDIEDGERERLDRSAIVQAREVGPPPAGVARLSLHIDLDALDPRYGKANQYAVGPGLAPEDLVAAVHACARDHELAAVTLSAYDPAYDDDGRVREAARAVLTAVRG